MDESAHEERVAFMRVLTSLAWADGVVAPEETELLRQIADELQVPLSEKAPEGEADLSALASQITSPQLRVRLLDELAKLCAADQDIASEEIEAIRYLATTWELKPPLIGGVDWI